MIKVTRVVQLVFAAFAISNLTLSLAQTLPEPGAPVPNVVKTPDPIQPGPGQNQPTDSFAGLRFGVGLALTTLWGGAAGPVSQAELDGNGIIRSTNEVGSTPRVMLESHFFFTPHHGSTWYCPRGNTCSHGPFVAIEPAGSGANVISTFGLGWMLGYKRNNDASDKSSWNLGIGAFSRAGVQVLGDGLTANEPLPARDTIRYKTISQSGWFVLTSFSF